MGALLPMRLRPLLLFLACVLTASCGTFASEDAAISQTTAFFKRQQDFQPRFIDLLRDEKPALQVGFIEQDSNGTLLLEQHSDDFSLWLSPDGVQLILQDGILHSVRGLGEGLLASELSQPIVRVRENKPGWSDRFHTYLDGNDRAVSRTYRCLIEQDGFREVEVIGGRLKTRLMRENCRSLDQDFTNLYWVDVASREIILSRQWAGPIIGPISMRVVFQ